MAARVEEASCSPEGLICPLCLDVFEDATLLSCGHTFCRKCLTRYDASHLDRDHMVCPLCRSTTKLQETRVEGLPANVTVNGLVADYHSNTGGILASLEVKVVFCSMCKLELEAVSFCMECRTYMCDNCHSGHQRMITLFANHQVLPMSELSSGKFNIHQHTERCPIHRQENRDLFCEECRVYICLKCAIVAHRDHLIKNHHDFERELQMKVESLLERCKARNTEPEKNIQNTEARHREVHAVVQKIRTEVRNAYEQKARQLKENERLLLEKLLHSEEIGKPSLRVSRTVDLRDNMSGLTVGPPDNVVIGYTSDFGADKVDTNGITSQRFPQDGCFHDLAYQSRTGITVVSWKATTLKIYGYERNCPHTSIRSITNCSNFPVISSNRNDEIVIANYRNDRIMIYDPDIRTKLCSITTKDPPYQAFETRSGAIIASTGSSTNPGKLTVYDRSGRLGDTLTADPGEYLYAAVDSQDRVYVASVNQGAGKVVFTEYKMDGLKFEQVLRYEELKLALDVTGCYMVCMSCDLIAFASGKKLYFIELLLQQ